MPEDPLAPHLGPLGEEGGVELLAAIVAPSPLEQVPDGHAQAADLVDVLLEGDRRIDSAGLKRMPLPSPTGLSPSAVSRAGDMVSFVVTAASWGCRCCPGLVTRLVTSAQEAGEPAPADRL